MNKIRILCVDDHVVVRDGIGAVLNLQPDITLAASASTGREALEQYRKFRPDVTLMDLRLTDMSGFDAIRSEFRNAKIVVLSFHEGDADIREAMDAGAQGYVAKGMVREEPGRDPWIAKLASARHLQSQWDYLQVHREFEQVRFRYEI
jgi:DNA-binding NarL/FixJ family response regulator